MSETTTTTEYFPQGTLEDRMREERQLKLDAGAKSSEYTGSPDTGWTLTTVWENI